MIKLLATALLLAPQGLSDAEYRKLSETLRFENQPWREAGPVIRRSPFCKTG